VAFTLAQEYISLYPNLRKNKKVKYDIHDIGGEIVKANETYLLKDNRTLKNLVVSSTLLNPLKETRGHKHKGQEEVYYFIHGHGEMELGSDTFKVNGGDVVLIPDGSWHKVKNTSNDFLYFVCVFDGQRYDNKEGT